MKTAAALILCLGYAAAASDEEQARARLLLQRAVEKARAGVKKAPSALSSAPAAAPAA